MENKELRKNLLRAYTLVSQEKYNLENADYDWNGKADEIENINKTYNTINFLIDRLEDCPFDIFSES